MDREVAVAHIEPDRLGEFAHGLEAKECVTLYAPSALLAEQASHGVGDRIQVRRNVQTPPLQVVSGIHDECELLRRENLTEAFDKFCASRAARKHHDHAGPRA